MAVKKTIEIDIEAKTDRVISEIENVKDEVKDLNDSVIKGNKNVEKSLDSVEKSSKSLSQGVKGFGLALKAAGIGLIISALTAMKDVFSQNQRVVDVFSTVFETLSIVVNQVVGAFVDTYDIITKSSENFDALGKVVKGILTIAITPLKAAFYGITLGIQQAQLWWERSFFGDGDPKKIQSLIKGIKETKEALKEVGDDAVNAGKNVYNNFKEAVGEIGNIASVAAEQLSEVSIKSAYEQAKTNVALKNSAQIAAAEQGRLVEQYDRQAEKLRQIRDEERNSIEERRKANEDLLKTLEAQEKAMLSQAGLQVAAAQAEYNKSKTTENQVALIEALANKEGVLAQIEGLRSEQKANDLALDRESIELTNAKLESESKLSIERQRFNAEQIENELERLQKLKEIDLLEAEQEAERLQVIYDNAFAGTQAKIDAEIALNEFLEQSRQTNITRDKEISDAQKKIDEATLEAKKKVWGDTAEGLTKLSGIVGESTVAGKGLAIASATINTYRGVTDALAATTITPFDTALKFINAAAILSNGLKTVKNIVGVKIPKTQGGAGAGGASSPSGAAISQPPAFNVVGQGGTNQLAQVIGEQTQQPVQAYVVANDVTSAQSLQRNIQSEAGIGG